MTIALVTHAFVSDLTNGGSTPAANTTGATFLVLSVSGGAIGGITPTDTYGNTWVPLTSYFSTNLQIWYVPNATVGTGHTVTVSHGGIYAALDLSAWSGITAVHPLATGSDVGTNSAGPTLGVTTQAPNQAGALVITAFMNNTSGTTTAAVSSGFTILDAQGGQSGYGGGSAYQIQTAAAATNPIWTVGASSSGMGVAAAVFLAVDAPAVVPVTYTVTQGGDIPNLFPSGTASVTTPTWSSGIVTITTDAPHGMTTGALFAGFVSVDEDIHIATSPWFGEFTCTVTGASTFTYAVVSNPGTIPSGTVNWINYALYTAMGAVSGTPDLTLYSLGQTCSGTAADSSHIVLTSSDAAKPVIGHPVTWNGVTCLITSISGTAASVSAIGGFPTNFGGVPQSGDAYTIHSISVTFNLGLAPGGGRMWTTSVCNHNSSIIKTGPNLANVNSFFKLKGIYPFSKTVALGSPADNGSAIVVALVQGASPFDPDHTALVGVGSGYTYFESLQLWDQSTDAGDGVFITTAGFTDPWFITNCVIRGDNAYVADLHCPWIMQSLNPAAPPAVCVNTVWVGTAGPSQYGAMSTFNAKHSMFMSTNNAETTLTSGVSSGTTLLVASNVGIVAAGGGAAGSYVSAINSGSITTGANVLSVTGTVSPFTVILQGGSIAGTLSSGAGIHFGTMNSAIVPAAGALVAENSAFLGIPLPAPSSAFTSSAADSNPAGASGLTLVSYGTAINAGSTLGNSSLIDARVPTGSALLGAGVYDATVPLDIFGQTRPNPPSIGAAEFIVSGVFTGSLSDTAVSSDALIASLSFAVSLFDTAASSDSLTGVAHFSGALSDTAASSDTDTGTSAGNYTGSLSDSGSSSDSVIGYFASLGALSDTATSSDTLTGTAANFAALFDTAISSDSDMVPGDYFGNLSDSATSSDTLAFILSVLTSLGKPLNATLSSFSSTSRMTVLNPSFVGLFASPQRMGATRAGETVSRGADFSNALAVNDTIASVTSVTVARRDGVAITTGGMVITPAGAPAPWIVGNSVNWWHQTGATSLNATPIDYVVTITVITASGEDIVRDLYILEVPGLG